MRTTVPKVVDFAVAFIVACLPLMVANANPNFERESCYTTRQGVEVITEIPGRCPSQKVITAETDQFLSRYGAGHQSLDGLKVIVVEPKRLGHGVMGRMMSPNEVWVDGRYRDWIFREIYAHEAAHALLGRVGLWPGWLHCGYENPGHIVLYFVCPGDAHAAELLPAAEATGISRPLLSKDSRFAKAFANYGLGEEE